MAASDKDAYAQVDYRGNVYTFARPDLPSIVDNMDKTHSFYEIEMLEHIRKHIDVDELIVDVGANIGNHTVFFAGVCGCNVISIEPFLANFVVLQKNIALNNLSRKVESLNIAVSDTSGYCEFDNSSMRRSDLVSVRSANATSGIRVRRIDDLTFPKCPRVIKIDIEGGEFDALRGAERLLRGANILVYAETLNENTFDRVSGFLGSTGYQIVAGFGLEAPSFLFAKPDDPRVQAHNGDPTVQLARLCVRTSVERRRCNADLEQVRSSRRELKRRPAYRIGRLQTAPFRFAAKLMKR